jgi:DNA-directed RNA polymerase subunit RPC12/RpoP
MIFFNPRGAPELACDHCGCRWVDRTNGNFCYECGSEVSDASIADFQRVLLEFVGEKAQPADGSR